MKGIKKGIIPIFISHMGCQNDCIFCNQKKISGRVDQFVPEEMKAHVESYLNTMSHEHIEIAFYGGSFTGIPVQMQVDFLKIAAGYKQAGKIQSIRLSTRPDYIDDEVLKRLQAFGVDLIELGCQSFDDEVLLASNRGHSAKSILSAVEQIKKFGISFGIQLMYGLPSDSFEKFRTSVEQTIVLSPECVRIYPALVIQGTQLEAQYNLNQFQPISLEQAINGVAYAVKRFKQCHIEVIRVGLQRTEEINLSGAIVAGPFHEAFGGLVMTEIFYQAIHGVLNAWDQVDQVNVWCHPSQVSYVRGHKKASMLKLKTKWSKLNMRPIQDSHLKLNQIVLEGSGNKTTVNVITGDMRY